MGGTGVKRATASSRPYQPGLVGAGACLRSLLSVANLVAQTANLFTIGIFWLLVAKFWLISHGDMPLAEGQPYLHLIERLHTLPLPDAILAQNTSLLSRALERVLQ